MTNEGRALRSAGAASIAGLLITTEAMVAGAAKKESRSRRCRAVAWEG